MEDYKNEIVSTRKGCLGGSDGRLLAQVASLGYVPKSAYKRLAVCKGLIEQENVTTAAMRYGDYIENAIYQHVTNGNDGYESNPMWVSQKYSRKNVKLICHPDIVRTDESTKTLYVYEVKATKYGLKETKDTYRAQLYIERKMAMEKATSLGNGWKVKTFLVHYSTYGLDIENGQSDFDIDRLSVTPTRFNTHLFDIDSAMDICNDFLETYDTYLDDDNVDVRMLPAEAQVQFNAVAVALREIKERERKVDEFKEKLYRFFLEKGIKRVSCDDFSFTMVEPTKQISVDYKKYFEEEIEAKHPYKAKKIRSIYKKEINKKGYVTIKLNDKKE